MAASASTTSSAAIAVTVRDDTFVGIFTIGCLGLLADWLARVAIRRAAPWIRFELDLPRA